MAGLIVLSRRQSILHQLLQFDRNQAILQHSLVRQHHYPCSDAHTPSAIRCALSASGASIAATSNPKLALAVACSATPSRACGNR